MRQAHLARVRVDDVGTLVVARVVDAERRSLAADCREGPRRAGLPLPNAHRGLSTKSRKKGGSLTWISAVSAALKVDATANCVCPKSRQVSAQTPSTFGLKTVWPFHPSAFTPSFGHAAILAGCPSPSTLDR